MTAAEATEALRRFIADGSHPAFAQIVHGTIDLVYAAALRQVDGRRIESRRR